MSSTRYLQAEVDMRVRHPTVTLRVLQIGARVMISAIFLLNGFGVIDQTGAAKELAGAGVPGWAVAPMVAAGRILQVAAGVALATGFYPRIAAAALLAFLVPATLVAHSFWNAGGTPEFVPQLIQFVKNLAMWGGLLFVLADAAQPALCASERGTPRRL
ncbi:MAG TPA: DoxX family protein [Bryobacteraceae bacterium]|nr:DoxX family protein [Bryobacteraceae bacterium]